MFFDIKSDAKSIQIVVALVVIVLTVGILFLIRKVSSSYSSARTNDLLTRQNSKTSASSSKPLQHFSAALPMDNNVWEERKQRGILPASMNKKEDAGDKPFGSSYYYAHNNFKAKGGYSDGLRMEDYTMNAPRLLSRGGNATTVAVELTKEEKKEDDIQEEIVTGLKQQQTSVPNAVRKQIYPRDITRYIWDDSGDSTGVGTIRIDTLPGKSTTEVISWADANIKTVDAQLHGEGLIVVATSATDGQTYRLKISKLFDKAVDVRTVVKPKRLLVKIHKKKSMFNFLGNSNLEPWPHPHRKHKF